MLALSSDLSNKFNTRNLCLAGGVALNCDMNFRLTNSGNFDNIYVQPAANDAGTALGSALEVSYQEAKSVGKSVDSYFIDHAQYGPSFTNDEIEHLLIESKISYRKIKNLKEVAQKIAQGKIVGWFRGRMEFGPRALGGRSILANPSIADMKDKINAECKHRENWRPFAPSVLDEYCNKYFELFLWHRRRKCIIQWYCI